MEIEQLRQTLRELHAELQSGERKLDAETAALVRELASDVSRYSSQNLPAVGEADAERETLMDRMLGVTEEFEESHPQLAEIIGRMATALSRIGI